MAVMSSMQTMVFSAEFAIAWPWNILDVAQLLASSIQVDEDHIT